MSWCDDPTVSGYTITRREGCNKLAVVIRWEHNGETVGTAIFAVREEILLENKAVFRERMFMSPLSLDASLGTVSLDYWDAICTPDCDEAYQGTWDGLTMWEPIVDTHWASATRTFTWNNAVSGTSEKFDRGTFLNFKAAAPEAAGAAATIKPSWTFWGEVECDNSVAVANSTGGVFAKNTPTWQTNTKRYPAAAAYYWVLREKLADHPGSKKYNKPMHRMTDKVQQEHNRNTICNKTGVGKWTAHPDATGDTQGVQCDEFPFAATLESGGIPTPVVNGGICAQLFASSRRSRTTAPGASSTTGMTRPRGRRSAGVLPCRASRTETREEARDCPASSRRHGCRTAGRSTWRFRRWRDVIPMTSASSVPDSPPF
ncbi:hypothetical protein [Streptomyces sp. NBC_01483]|uniref:hypothetical protein n=1 Tax=Streptomyces sp. NBC_01483 TaxID=2903883 RepID=UPI002E369D5F|nr:hypothetical protein [Streptomyces sp. NBC_01483]